MSRIGKKPLKIPSQVQIQIQDQKVTVTGPKGTLYFTIPEYIKVDVKDNEVLVTRTNEEKLSSLLHGTIRTQISNMISGVLEEYKKELEIQGVGYRASLKGKNLNLSLGFSHPIEISAPEGIVFSVPSETQIIITGANKNLVGQTAAKLHSLKKPEPYKGKGIRYVGEYVARKEGKKAAK